YHTFMGEYLAFDLGAESGRAMAGKLSGGQVTVEEIHRFPNNPVREGDSLYWDTEGLWREILRGIDLARERQATFTGVGIDTWGVDYALLDRNGKLADRPRHYRDARNNDMMAKVFERVPREEVYAYTGIQLMQINTLYQLYAESLSGSALPAAHNLLNMP